MNHRHVTLRPLYLIFFMVVIFAIVPACGEKGALAGIDAVLEDSVDRRLEGREGGEAGMAVFSSYGHVETSYKRNPRLWCADLASELCGVAVFKAGPGSQRGVADSYGGVMITPRHILFCNHAHPTYVGSPPPWINGLGHQIRFVSADDKVIERELVWGGRVEGVDLWIGVLNEDVPESVGSYRIFPDLKELVPEGGSRKRAVEVGFSQGSFRLGPEHSHTKFEQLCGNCETAHYGTRTVVEGVPMYEQVPMIYVSDSSAVDCGKTKGPELRERFRYCVWDGDSGTPRFHLFGDELLLSRIVLSSGGGGVPLGPQMEKINAAIEAIDLEAVEQGRLEKTTGHKPQVATAKELQASP